jgi:hypothetical protein
LTCLNHFCRFGSVYPPSWALLRCVKPSKSTVDENVLSRKTGISQLNYYTHKFHTLSYLSIYKNIYIFYFPT